MTDEQITIEERDEAEAVALAAEAAEAEEKKHWIDDDTTRKAFWAFAKTNLRLTEGDVHEALGCEHVREFGGDKAAAFEKLKARAAEKTREADMGGRLAKREEVLRALELTEHQHSEAQTIAWMDIYLPTGEMVSLTARQGATTDALVAAALALESAVIRLQDLDWTTRPAAMLRRKPAPEARIPDTPAPPREPPAQADAPPQPTAQRHAPPSPPAAGPPQPPPSTAPSAPEGDTPKYATGGLIKASIIKIVAPKGRPIIEFWNKDRRWAEISYALSAASFVALAPELVDFGYTEEHFTAVGAVYNELTTIRWEPSKTGQYRDIVKVTLQG